LIAAAFEQDGYDQATLTPRTGDYGRDAIATKSGIGCVQIIDSVKAFAPHRLAGRDDVRAPAGVLHGDPKASKGIITTTSDFAAGIATDPALAPFMRSRLELTNGARLQEWLTKRAKGR
jgi:restriction system protein